MAFWISTSGNAGILYMSARRTPSGVTSQSVKAPIVPANDRGSFLLVPATAAESVPLTGLRAHVTVANVHHLEEGS